MRVAELMKKKNSELFTIRMNTKVSAVVGLLLERQIGCLPVIGPGGSVVGLVSERDVVQAVDGHTESIRGLAAEAIMRRPAPSCMVNDLLVEVMDRMTRERLRHLVVLDGDRPAGVISVGDLVKHRLEQLETETGVLRDYLTARRAGG